MKIPAAERESGATIETVIGERASTTHVINIAHRRLTIALLTGVLLTTLASLIADGFRFFWPFHGVSILVATLSLDAENNLPTWYATMLLAVAAGLLGVMALTSDGWRRSWGGLAAIFTYLSADEAASLHEKVNRPAQKLLDAEMFHPAWLIPASILLVVFLGAYLRFVLSLPLGLRRSMITAGVVYIAGAVGMELVGGVYASTNGFRTLPYAVMTTAEEVLEMLGVVLLIHALVGQLATQESLVIRVGDSHGHGVAQEGVFSETRTS